MTRILLIGLALVLVGCAAEPAPRTYVEVTMKEPKHVQQCIKRSVDSEGRTGTGDLLECGTMYNFNDGTRTITPCTRIKLDANGCYTKDAPDIRSMLPEEFTFKYDHDKAFRASIASYSFR